MATKFAFAPTLVIRTYLQGRSIILLQTYFTNWFTVYFSFECACMEVSFWFRSTIFMCLRHTIDSFVAGFFLEVVVLLGIVPTVMKWTCRLFTWKWVITVFLAWRAYCSAIDFLLHVVITCIALLSFTLTRTALIIRYQQRTTSTNANVFRSHWTLGTEFGKERLHYRYSFHGNISRPFPCFVNIMGSSMFLWTPQSSAAEKPSVFCMCPRPRAFSATPAECFKKNFLSSFYSCSKDTSC